MLYGRNCCHLCQDMLAALEALRGEHDFDIEQVDVDADAATEKRYDELVPVLTDANGREICHYYLDEQRVCDYLVNFRPEFG